MNANHPAIVRDLNGSKLTCFPKSKGKTMSSPACARCLNEACLDCSRKGNRLDRFSFSGRPE